MVEVGILDNNSVCVVVLLYYQKMQGTNDHAFASARARSRCVCTARRAWKRSPYFWMRSARSAAASAAAEDSSCRAIMALRCGTLMAWNWTSGACDPVPRTPRPLDCGMRVGV